MLKNLNVFHNTMIHCKIPDAVLHEKWVKVISPLTFFL